LLGWLSQSLHDKHQATTFASLYTSTHEVLDVFHVVWIN